MSNVEGERIMGGAGGVSADLGIVRGPKSQAAELLAELQQLRLAVQDVADRQMAGEQLPMSDTAMELVNDYYRKRDDAVLFLLEQFSK